MNGHGIAEPGQEISRPVRTGEPARPSAAAAPVNPEASALVSAYRRAVPVAVRRAIAGRSSPELRRRVKRGAGTVVSARQLNRLRAARLADRRRDLVLAPGRTVVTVAGRPRIAFVERELSPVLARTAALGAVTAALERGGVEHFCVRGRERGSAVVAVAAEDRPQVLRTLAGLCRVLPGYVGIPGPAGAAPRAAAHRFAVPGPGAPRSLRPGYEPWVWRRLAAAPVLRVVWFRTDPRHLLVLGAEHGCDVEFWSRVDGRLVAPRRGGVTESVPAAAPAVRVSAALFAARGGPRGGSSLRVRTREEFTRPLPGDVAFPVDVVYTWVDGSDAAWLSSRARFSDRAYHEEAANAARYANRDELRYSLRSLETYAPWVRRIHIVTDDQTPHWLDTSEPRVRMVSHREIFRDPRVLPTFNSHAIESQLHRIEGLSEHFLYFNDDVFLGREAAPQDFFLANGLTTFFPSPALVPFGPPSDEDVPVSVAAKNNRALIERRFGTTPVQKMKHVPHALRRSVLAEIEEEFAEQHRATAAHRFRSLDDIAIPSSLHHYYAFHTGRALPGTLDYAYVDLSRPNAENRLDRLLADRDRAVFCLNDTASQEADIVPQTALLRSFLDAYFPLPAPYELPDGAYAPRGEPYGPPTGDPYGQSGAAHEPGEAYGPPGSAAR